MSKPVPPKTSDSIETSPSRRTKADLRKLLEEVSEQFCKGVPPKKISERLKGEFGPVKREAAYRLLQRAAQEHILVFRRPEAQEVEEKLQARLREYGVEIRVASTTVYSDVAAKTADLVADLLTDTVRKRAGQKAQVRLGWAGGELCRMIAQELANRIKRPDRPFPKKIICQTLVGALAVDRPMLHPNAFFSYFYDEETATSGIEFEFEALYAPIIVSQSAEKLLKEDQYLVDATQHAKDSDLVVTSVGRWDDPRNMLAEFYKRLGKAAFLEELGCVGDFLNLPFRRTGPIPWEELAGKHRPLTLLDHTDVKEMIKKGTNVILAAGPCHDIGGELPKLRTDVIETVIRAGLATSICVDFYSGKALLARFLKG